MKNSYPKACPGEYNNRACRSKRFERTDDGNRWRWTCLVKKCGQTWTTTKEGKDSK